MNPLSQDLVKEAVSTAAATLLAAGLGGVSTGLLSSKIRKEEDDTPEGRKKRTRRIIRDAVIGASLGGATGFAGGHLLNESPFRGGKESNDDRGQITKMIDAILPSKVTGSPGVAVTSGMGGLGLGAILGRRDEAGKSMSILQSLSGKPDGLDPQLVSSMSNNKARKHLLNVFNSGDDVHKGMRDYIKANGAKSLAAANVEGGFLKRMGRRSMKPKSLVLGTTAATIPFLLSKLTGKTESAPAE